MNIDQFLDHPAIAAHFSDIARPLDEFLVAHLVETALGSKCTADTAQAEAAAAKAIANLIKTFRSVGNKPKAQRKTKLQPLHRFSAEQKADGESNPT